MMSSMEDWDLQAIVKGCSRRPIASSTTATTTKLLMEEYPNFYSLLSQEFDEFSCVYNPPSDQLFETIHDEFMEGFGSSINDNNPVLHPLVHPPHRQDPNIIGSASSISDLFRDFKEQQPAEKLHQKKQIAPTKQKQSKKSRQNRVVKEVKSDSVCSDSWGWRKYGQKPIKGSPYPRSYYRCSSSKGCSARKQVERSFSDPDVFVVTYTAEHNHAEPTRRNALAGTTRKKFPAAPENPRFDMILSPSNSTSVASIEEDQQPMEGVAEGEVLMDMPFEFSTEHLFTGLEDFLFG